MKNPLIELEPGEEVLAIARASFRGAAAATMRSTFALGSDRMRMRAYRFWYDAATASGFPTVPPDMVVLASNRRVLFGKPTFWGRTPKRYWSALDLDDIAQIAATSHGLVTGVAFALVRGPIVEIEALRGRKLRRVVRAVDEQLPHT